MIFISYVRALCTLFCAWQTAAKTCQPACADPSHSSSAEECRAHCELDLLLNRCLQFTTCFTWQSDAHFDSGSLLEQWLSRGVALPDRRFSARFSGSCAVENQYAMAAMVAGCDFHFHFARASRLAALGSVIPWYKKMRSRAFVRRLPVHRHPGPKSRAIQAGLFLIFLGSFILGGGARVPALITRCWGSSHRTSRLVGSDRERSQVSGMRLHRAFICLLLLRHLHFLLVACRVIGIAGYWLQGGRSIIAQVALGLPHWQQRLPEMTGWFRLPVVRSSGGWRLLLMVQNTGILIMIRKSFVQEGCIRYQAVVPGRVVHARLELQKNFHLVCVYQHGWTYQVAQEIMLTRRARVWDAIRNIVQGVPIRDHCYILGDMNTPCMPRAGHCGAGVLEQSSPPPDAETFMGLLEALDLCVLNSWSNRARSATYIHSKGKSQIDFVITRRLDAHPISRQACPLPDTGLFEWRAGGSSS